VTVDDEHRVAWQHTAKFLAQAQRLDLWANDYPHHEGCWPHSAAAIERNMGHLSDASRAKILGLNAARLFNLERDDR
jgi:predicted TIM-barrel fold metal-dependent hydrolase